MKIRKPLELIIHADDFGESVEISNGILEGIENAIITSTAILANMPATDLVLKEYITRAGKVSFGVHLNLCEGCPLTSANTLIQNDGRFLPKRKIAFKAVAGQINLKNIEAELSSQIEKVLNCGIKISHLDSHKHLHHLPGISRVVSQLAKKFGIKRIRCTLEREFWPRGMGVKARIFRAIRLYFADRAARQFRAEGLRHPKQAFDLKELMAIKDHKTRLVYLRRLNGLTEMYCHPGSEMADIEKPGSCARYDELQFLLSDEFRSLIKETPVELKTFWEC